MGLNQLQCIDIEDGEQAPSCDYMVRHMIFFFKALHIVLQDQYAKWKPDFAHLYFLKYLSSLIVSLFNRFNTDKQCNTCATWLVL